MKFKAKKISTYTGKVMATETFETSEQAIKFCNSNLSVTGAYHWVLSFKSIAI